MTAQGQGTAANPAEAIRLLSALPNNDQAQYKLGEIYFLYASSITDHAEKARHIFELLHKNSSQSSYRHGSAFYLGQINYGFGNGRKGYRAAADYLTEASREGEPAAQRLLSSLYFSGLGVPQSFAEAFKWATLAAANGDETAVNIRNAAEAKLTAADVSQIQSRVAKWGQGENVTVYDCRKSPDDGYTKDTFTIDWDTWAVKSNYREYYDLVSADQKELHIRTDSGPTVYVIDQFGQRLSIQDQSKPTEYEVCAVTKKGTTPY